MWWGSPFAARALTLCPCFPLSPAVWTSTLCPHPGSTPALCWHHPSSPLFGKKAISESATCALPHAGRSGSARLGKWLPSTAPLRLLPNTPMPSGFVSRPANVLTAPVSRWNSLRNLRGMRFLSLSLSCRSPLPTLVWNPGSYAPRPPLPTRRAGSCMCLSTPRTTVWEVPPWLRPPELPPLRRFWGMRTIFWTASKWSGSLPRTECCFQRPPWAGAD